ncbi:13142_t:CDS:2 [Funneliformis mosseae]|uniref:13142_t:CDS:1 n=1 Tax=Funneliformis mosseae TaxID=27381 RepID=A0A9N9GUE6_FUNMO|nr:13142_t:CDS:2 [Funneliformis mosseae]
MVLAVDKDTGISIAEDEKYREEDEKFVVRKIQARNGLEINRTKRSTSNRQRKLEVAIQESITWLEINQEAEKKEYDYKQESLEEIVDSIIKQQRKPTQITFSSLNTDLSTPRRSAFGNPQPYTGRP